MTAELREQIMIDHSREMIRVLLVDDHSVVREGVRMILENDDSIAVVGEAGDIDTALSIVKDTRLDIVLLDLALGTGSSIDYIRQMIELQPAARILVLTGVADEELHKRALLSGAHGLLKKDEGGSMIRTAIKKVHAGEAWIDRNLTATVLLAAAIEDESKRLMREKISSLTERELDIVKLVAAGQSNQSIANTLCISEKTVRNRLTVIFDKLDVSSRLELSIFASANDLKN